MIVSQNEYYNETFEKIDVQDKILKSIEFHNCTFRNCIFNKTTLQLCKFTECSFENCDLSLLKLKSTVFNDVTIISSKAIGIDWSSCTGPFFAIDFENSNISMSSFFRMELKNHKIISCVSHEVDFTQANLEKTDFEGTDLLNSLFDGTNLKYADLSLAKNYTINPELNALKGTKASLNEAVSFLEFLGLDIVN